MGGWSCMPRRVPRRPNIILILADDLGYGELGCYGQEKIRTPHIDRLAAEGMRFSQFYSGSPVCAPSRCTLLTGKHTGNAYIRDNDEMSERGDVWHDPELEGQRPLPPGSVTLGTVLKRSGYVTSCIGKWGLGGPGTTGHPNNQGFDHFYGYLCQRAAHNYYPTHLWKNQTKEMLEGNPYFNPHQRMPDNKDPRDPLSYAPYSGRQYAPDLMREAALNFIRENRNRPFFLYFATPVPHVSLQVPEDALEAYEGAFPEEPYLGERGYVPHRTPRAAYAAMISRMDADIGGILALVEDLGLDEDTLIMLTSDNGPTYAGGVDYAFFRSAGALRGLKGSVYEGGLRVPMIARWPGRIEAGTETHHPAAFWDMMPTICEITGADCPLNGDGLSLAPVFLGKGKRAEHEYLYWEFPGYGSQQAVRLGRWKGLRRGMAAGNLEIELYDLAADPGEQADVSEAHPAVVARIEGIMESARTASELFPLRPLDENP